MTVRALFFAAYRDLAGSDALEVRLPDGARVSDLVASLRARDAALARLPERPAVAVNLEYAASDSALRDGDEVALIPPVSGG
jgi:molybdopterin converting factor subunit 1